MAETSSIEWTDATWNPITGCSVVSPGCTNCYAMKLAGGRLQGHPSRAGLTTPSKAGPVWNGQVRFNDAWLTQPLRWTRPRMIFVCAHGDLFHEAVPDAWIDQVFAVMALAPHHTFQVLTKRAARMREYMRTPDRKRTIAATVMEISMRRGRESGHRAMIEMDHFSACFSGDGTFPNVWLGVSAEDQARANERILELLATPAAVRFVSLEPFLGPVDLNRLHWRRDLPGGGDEQGWESCLNGKRFDIWSDGDVPAPKLDWVIAGGESGDRAMHPDWPRKVRDDCAVTGTAFFFKQWGDFAPAGAIPPDAVARGFSQWLPGSPEGASEVVYRVGKKAAGRLLDGVIHDAMPERRSDAR